MKVMKASALTLAAMLFAAPAMALTIENQDAEELKFGIDEGNTEHVETVAAGATGDFTDKCKDGCGLTGPWGFSWMAEPGDTLVIKDGAPNGAKKISVSPET